LGGVLKHLRVINGAFLTTSDRLVYYIFFPALLFWKIGGADQTFSPESLRFYISALGAIILIYILSTGYILLFHVSDFQAGTFSQSCYRFNTYIGVAVISTVWAEPGIAQFGILIAMAIPLINVLAVMTLIWFSGQTPDWRRRLYLTLAALVKNPLIIACAAGIAYAHWINTFPLPLENTLKLGAAVTLPLALISIGSSLTFQTVIRHFPLAMVGSLFKLAVLPATGWLLMRHLGVDQSYYPLGMLFFSLPTSSAIYVLSAQLNSDTELASAAIVLSTVLSFFSMSAVLWFFHG
jgi:predicted permease